MWNSQEVDQYKKSHVVNSLLSQLYASEGLVSFEPWKRAQYLAETLELTSTDHDLLMGVAKEEGRAAALILLESMVIDSYV